MEVDEQPINGEEHTDRWNHVQKLLVRKGPFNVDEFQASPELFKNTVQICKILVIGAGGLGCELLKDLALMGFKNIHVIDMDTIDVSNLNRQFLFRQNDVGRFKAEVAAEFINKRIVGTNVVAHNCKIQDYDEDFYSEFHLIVCGLDSIVARRWINGMVMSLLPRSPPIIDGGTEGFKGNARVIIPGQTACIECTLDLFPPQINFPLCTIAHTPRLPEHCVEYVKLLLWRKENPFSNHANDDDSIPIDGDDPQHITWIFEKALERANNYGIRGVTYRLTQGVVKRIIPAVASTNAVIAAACAMEAFKMATSCANYLKNYMVFNDADGIYTFAYEAEKKEDCLACSQNVKDINISGDAKLQEFIDMLVQDPSYQMKNPGATTNINGKNKTLYMSMPISIEEATRPNLKKSFRELGLETGYEVVVADATTPIPLTFRLNFE